MKIKSPYLVKPRAKIKLSRIDASVTGGFKSHAAAEEILVEHRNHLIALQEVFNASQKKALLIVLQGMDTGGKDGAISHIFSGVNPQGCDVAAFKPPTPLEERHDFLWRIHSQVPPRGMIQIFNRSHYEDILVPSVHKLLPPKDIKRRLENIRAFESILADNDVLMLKFFLHISRKEQTSRLQSRIDTPEKHWKLSEGDFQERKYWDQYQQAYEELLPATSTKHAPWFIIPADHKWYRNVVISQILVDLMTSLNLTFPEPTMDASKIKL
ncbi:MAG: polyphosphate kinase 2 family protein [Edaphobacter sp.]|uniref:polyphosphate kinase 2 family protein n=1 Tax=Edaphobacter sp. TaxID=1934404 RepID=UPI00239AFDD0|nr:polyphosphate kinase 2 family protein [Edaphobacter sp.]MDE1175947.1 polyphosphate kinase 2 family protein [Edaphobacter sp.]